MGFTAFEIKLDNTHQSYFAGQIVSGKIVIGLDRTKKVKGVKLKLIGKAKTHWQENRGKSSTTISESEYYIDEKVYLFGYDESNTEVFLPHGWNEYPFWFQLPQNIPSSFEMKHGYVKYYLEVIISRESSFKFDRKLTKLFTVNALLDLNANSVLGNESAAGVDSADAATPAPKTATSTPDSTSTNEGPISTVDVWNARHEIELFNEKSLCCCCCTSGPISFLLKIPKTGYVPGESIAFRMQLSNASQRNIDLITLTLAQYSTFYAKKKSKQVTTEVATINGPPLASGQTEVTWEDDSKLTIPPVPPTNLGGGCNIITVEYFVKVELDIPGGLSLKGKVPVIIGTIPLRSSSEQNGSTVNGGGAVVEQPRRVGGNELPAAEPPYTSSSPNRPRSSAQLHLAVHADSASEKLSQPLIAGYPNLPPPTYEEAVFSYSAKQRQEDGLDEDEQGDDDENDSGSRPPDYTNVAKGNSGDGAGAAAGENGNQSDDDETGAGDKKDKDAAAGGGDQQQSSAAGKSSAYFVPKYVTYKHLGSK